MSYFLQFVFYEERRVVIQQWNADKASEQRRNESKVVIWIISRLSSTWGDIFSYLKIYFGVGVCLKSCYLQISLISYINALLCISCEYWIVIWFFSVVVCIRIRFFWCVFILLLHKSISRISSELIILQFYKRFVLFHIRKQHITFQRYEICMSFISLPKPYMMMIMVMMMMLCRCVKFQSLSWSSCFVCVCSCLFAHRVGHILSRCMHFNI